MLRAGLQGRWSRLLLLVRPSAIIHFVDSDSTDILCHVRPSMQSTRRTACHMSDHSFRRRTDCLSDHSLNSFSRWTAGPTIRSVYGLLVRPFIHPVDVLLDRPSIQLTDCLSNHTSNGRPSIHPVVGPRWSGPIIHLVCVMRVV